MKEESITRSTIYIPKYLHKKAKEAGINISQELKTYLETILFGDQITDVNYQLEQVIDRIKTMNIELTALNERKKELEKIISEHDTKMAAERALYNKFMNHINNRIKNAMNSSISLDIRKLQIYWRDDFFPGNGLSNDTVLNVIDLVKNECFDFDHFRSMRKGDSIES